MSTQLRSVGHLYVCSPIVYAQLNADAIGWKYYVRFMCPLSEPVKFTLHRSFTVVGSYVKRSSSGFVSLKFSFIVRDL